MAGSRRPFAYQSDANEFYVVQLDETTYEQVELGFAGSTPGGSLAGVIIRGNPIKMRYVNAYRQEGNVTIRRRFFVGSPDTDIYLNGGILQLAETSSANAVEGGEEWIVSSSVGEKRKFIGLRDTGKTEGDIDTVEAPPPPDA